MKMKRKSFDCLSKDIIMNTTKRLDDDIWKYDMASQILLKSCKIFTVDTTKDDLSTIGKISLSLNDEKFDDKKKIISRSRMMKSIVKQKGLVVSVDFPIKEKELLAKFIASMNPIFLIPLCWHMLPKFLS